MSTVSASPALDGGLGSKVSPAPNFPLTPGTGMAWAPAGFSVWFCTLGSLACSFPVAEPSVRLSTRWHLSSCALPLPVRVETKDAQDLPGVWGCRSLCKQGWWTRSAATHWARGFHSAEEGRPTGEREQKKLLWS